MTLSYAAPLDEMRFVLNDIFDAPTFWQNTPALSHVDSQTVEMILDEMAKFATSTLLPLNQLGDDTGAIYLGDGKVATPKGFKEAFKLYADAGWMGLGGDPNFGGQGMPKMVSMLAEEMLFATNQSFAYTPISPLEQHCACLPVAVMNKKHSTCLSYTVVSGQGQCV